MILLAFVMIVAATGAAIHGADRWATLAPAEDCWIAALALATAGVLALTIGFLPAAPELTYASALM